MHIPAALAPVKAAVLPLVKKDGLPEVARDIQHALKCDFNVQYDEKDSIGKRYRRQDAIGTPFCITVDHRTLEDKTVTVRHRDSMEQQRVAIADLSGMIAEETGFRKLFAACVNRVNTRRNERLPRERQPSLFAGFEKIRILHRKRMRKKTVYERNCTFPGSFDPFTLGHKFVVDQGLELFDRIVIAIGVNSEKAGLLTPDNRARLIRDLYRGEPRIEVRIYTEADRAVVPTVGRQDDSPRIAQYGRFRVRAEHHAGQPGAVSGDQHRAAVHPRPITWPSRRA